MKSRKVFVTGMSGYIGTRICRELDRLDWCEKFYGMDVKKPLYKYEKGEFRVMDINDPGLIDWVSEIKPDILIHLAYVLQEMHDVDLMRRINFEGSKNALKAASKAGISQILVASSGTAYGAWPDNPVLLKEDDTLRPNPGFFYAVDKARIEGLCQEYLKDYPDTIMSLIRPCVVYGPHVDNYLSELLNWPVYAGFKGHKPPLQCVHEDDVVRAIICILENQAKGCFNIAPADTVTLEEVYKLTKRPYLMMPDFCVSLAVALIWNLRIPILNISCVSLDYIRFPWVIDNSRFCDELGFMYQYSTRETVEIMLQSKGILS